MYNLLIVDDEKIIRDGLYELLSMEERLELNLSTAASAVEAEKLLSHKKIDIVLTDIQMPKVSGIQLMDIILERWPHCKVIFLTGYSEFEYVYKVHKHARYVLKAEEDEKIIEAILESIEEIESDFMIEKIVEDTSRLRAKQEGYEQSRFLYDLLNGLVSQSSLRQELFTNLNIPLKIDQSLYYLIMRYDELDQATYEENLKILEDLNVLVDKYFLQQSDGIVFNYLKNFIILLLQPKAAIDKQAAMQLQGNCELFQKACYKNFQMNVSMALSAIPIAIQDWVRDFQTIKSKLLMSADDHILVIDHTYGEESEEAIEKEQQMNVIKSKLELLDYYFENSNKNHVLNLIEETLAIIHKKEDMDNLFIVEVYSDIAVNLIKYINRMEMSKEIRENFNVDQLYNVTLHKRWDDAFVYLTGIIEFIFQLKMSNLKKQKDDVVKSVKEYIHEHLSEDTSLDVLSDQVGLSPEYVLRLFKKSEGITILQYINDLKVIKAKRLIADANLQIKDIANRLGYTSSGYFGRFFKSKTGMSPQAYREQLNSEQR